uniref:Uncharacterized protein n=1 Tax=Romanomermis culicivorax TaxID=13658 RepID=A0A915K0L3_ROMCU
MYLDRSQQDLSIDVQLPKKKFMLAAKSFYLGMTKNFEVVCNTEQHELSFLLRKKLTPMMQILLALIYNTFVNVIVAEENRQKSIFLWLSGYRQKKQINNR